MLLYLWEKETVTFTMNTVVKMYKPTAGRYRVQIGVERRLLL